MEALTLHSTVGRSDKLYQLSVRPVDGGVYDLHYSNGSRTGGLTPGKRPKTEKPVSLGEVEKLFAQLERKQRAKGYHDLGKCALCANEDVAESVPTNENAVDSSVNATCQLLTALKGADDCRTLEDFLRITEALRNDDEYCFEQKHDGTRILLRVDDAGNVVAYNRTEKARGMSSAVINEVKMFKLSGSIMFDGENIGDKFHVFDLVEMRGLDLRSATYDQRKAQLTAVLKAAGGKLAAMVPTDVAYTTEAKTALVIEMFERKMEGVVAKRRSSTYYSGRDSKQFKVKFVKEASFIVTEVNPKGKYSVTLGIINGAGNVVSAGHVSIRPCISHVKVDDILDVRYLYARRSSGHIVQAVAQRIRTDIRRSECVGTQLKYKENE